MFRFIQINLINLILCLSTAELNSPTTTMISKHLIDSNSSSSSRVSSNNHNNNDYYYYIYDDKPNINNNNNIMANNKTFNSKVNDQHFADQLPEINNQTNLEEIAYSRSPGVTRDTEEKLLENFVDNLKTAKFEDSWPELNTPTNLWEIESTTSHATLGVTRDTEEKLLENFVDKLKTEKFEDSWPELNTPTNLWEIESTTSHATLGVTRDTEEKLLENFVDKLKTEKFEDSWPELNTQSSLEESIITANEFEFTTPYATPGVTWDTEEKLLENSLDKLKTENEENICLLDSLKTALLWWCYTNGTLKETNLNVLNQTQQLDLSYQNFTKDQEIFEIISRNQDLDIVAFSLAFNNLTKVPYKTLELMSKSLKYLTLMGNPFEDISQDISDHNLHCLLNDDEVYIPENQETKRFLHKNQEGIDWSRFPYMPQLQELDISKCNIEFITKSVFQNLTNLKSLYMSYNKLLTIPSDTFFYTPNLQILDLSFTNVYDSFMNQLVASPTLESVMKLIYGVNIQQNTFKYLPNLIYLDLSHTKLTRSSAVAFTHLGENLKYLSLCFTSFPVYGNGVFKNSSLIGLDLSGNTHAAFSLTEDVFEGLADSLVYLYIEKSNIKDLSWLKPLRNLRYLALAGNNINTLHSDYFKTLKQLQVLDLTSNQVGNWYSQVFKENENLKILSLRDNNINIITSEMLKDFSMLVYLSLGDNNFICDCLLRDLVDIATVNNQQARCKGNIWSELKDNIHINQTHLALILENSKLFFNTSLKTLDIPSLVWSQNLKKLKKSFRNYAITHKFNSKPKLRFVLEAFTNYNETKTCHYYNNSVYYDDRLNSSLFKLQLLDYEEEHYWCYNETEKQNLIKMNCQRLSLVEDIQQELDNLTNYVIISVGILVSLTLLGILIYWKRWHIFYYYSSLKSAALLSSVSQENLHKFNNFCDQNPHMIYDIFISYCQSDRDWVVQELMPNVEESGDISICLHERDFQIGVTILDNIMSCMDRSKALMLIISSNFLLSHWCQFEMQLAQQHMFDLNKDHMILVFLEDIPRSKRPKILQYLMNVKTYIKWPGGKGKKDIHPEERKLFWKRLKRTLRNIGLNPTESRA